ncbi:MAG: YidC/Oxa1 family membrane protein insertase, partial [Bacteroidales bacterium]|nr:YidC/Oxa1 family membrane protein insertase [Bacteroidales bacterium]
MDKNTVTGLLLITAIIIAFTIYNRPNREQIEAQQRMRDSIAMVETERAQLEALQKDPGMQPDIALSGDAEKNVVADFFSAGSFSSAIDTTTVSTLGQSEDLETLAQQPSISSAVQEESVVLENEKVRILLSTRGGAIQSVQLKEYLHHSGENLLLFDGRDEARFNLNLFNRNSVHLSTEEHIFTPVAGGDNHSVTMRLQQSPGQYIDFVYTL